jgi:uncharacterized protein
MFKNFKFLLIVGILIFIVGIFTGYSVKSNISMNDKISEVYNSKNSINVPIVVASDDTSMIGNIRLETIPGTGRILFDTNPSLETDIQYSIIIAKAYAEEYTGKTLNESDLIIDITLPLDVIGGVSAGAPITIGIIALLEDKKLNESIVLTGTINPDGTIGRVGEVREKATEVSKNFDIILVPQRQSYMWRQNSTIEEYLNKTIIVKEVATIDEASSYMIIS